MFCKGRKNKEKHKTEKK
uniref:Uncharacterized protein n=1 Tax=Anguilla anguilla TaxID=7936 RepID=A0A0E9TX98_ANGAN